MKLLFLLTVVLELSLNSPPRATRRRRVPPSSRQVRRRLRRLRARQLLVALFAASTLQWITRKPRNHHSQYPGRGAYSARLGRPVRPPTLPTPARPPAFQTARPNGGRARAFLRRAREIFTARCTSSAFGRRASPTFPGRGGPQAPSGGAAAGGPRRGAGGERLGAGHRPRGAGGERLGAGHRPRGAGGERLGARHCSRGAGGSGSRAATVRTRSRASRRARPAHLGQAATLPPPARS
jgi:hypothetical protein